jgi:hypothetical protein
MSHVNHRRTVPTRRDPIARDLRTPKYRMRVVESKRAKFKTAYQLETDQFDRV